MIAAVPMKDSIVMIDGRLSRDHEAIQLEPQKKGKQEPQIVMVYLLFVYLFSTFHWVAAVPIQMGANTKQISQSM